MKQEKYKKMLSEMFRGENNPNSKSKTTEEQRRQRSPFSKKFIKYNNENEALEFARKVNNNIPKEHKTTNIEYYLNKGYSQEESEIMLSERQKTFTLEKCIDKYGEIEGLNIWNERQKKWSEKIEKKYKNGDFLKFNKDMTSSPENEIFDIITEKLNIKDKCYYGKNQFYRTFKNLGRTFSYDFVYGKKIIEFNGDYWHCNPKKYPKNYFHKFLQMTADEIWKNNEIKNDAIKREGYDVLVIWESDYNKNKEKTIQECLDFLNLK